MVGVYIKKKSNAGWRGILMGCFICIVLIAVCGFLGLWFGGVPGGVIGVLIGFFLTAKLNSR